MVIIFKMGNHTKKIDGTLYNQTEQALSRLGFMCFSYRAVFKWNLWLYYNFIKSDNNFFSPMYQRVIKWQIRPFSTKVTIIL